MSNDNQITGGLPDTRKLMEIAASKLALAEQGAALAVNLPSPEAMRSGMIIDRLETLQTELDSLREIIAEPAQYVYSNEFDLIIICQKCRENILQNPPKNRTPQRSNRTAIFDFLENSYPEIADNATKNHIAVIANPDSKIRVRQKNE